MSSSHLSPVSHLTKLSLGSSLTVAKKRCRSDGFMVSSDNSVERSKLMEDYDFERVNAIRDNDVAALRAILEQGAKSFNACNRTGETLMHLACRRGSLDTVKFLVEEAKVDVHVQDDMGRTILHDLCWRPEPQVEIMRILIEVLSPEFLLIEDVRGHTCFDYCRREHWKDWVEFLKQHEHVLERRFGLRCMERSVDDCSSLPFPKKAKLERHGE